MGPVHWETQEMKPIKWRRIPVNLISSIWQYSPMKLKVIPLLLLTAALMLLVGCFQGDIYGT